MDDLEYRRQHDRLASRRKEVQDDLELVLDTIADIKDASLSNYGLRHIQDTASIETARLMVDCFCDRISERLWQAFQDHRDLTHYLTAARAERLAST